jgi:hypothetical protein
MNLALDDIDIKVLGVAHATSKAHWELWVKETVYPLGSVVRHSSLLSGQFLVCTATGTSGMVEPTDNSTGDSITDGGVTWKICLLAEAVTIHNSLTGRGVANAHPISAITDLQTALNSKVETTDLTTALNLKVDKVAGKDLSTNDYTTIDKTKVDNITITQAVDLDALETASHSHTNKTYLDKIGEDTNGNMTYDSKTIVGGATAWEPTTPYVLDQLVIYDNKLYKCKATHVSGSTFVLSSWQELTIGYIGNWEPLRYYSKYEVTINGNSIIRCSTAHTSRATYDTTEATNWSIIASRGAVVALWEPNTPYSKDEAVVYNDVIYLANSTHTSGSTFAGDMQTGTEKWRTINTSSTVGDWKQLTETNVSANTSVNITINNTLTFITPPVEILIYNAGSQGSVINKFTFVAGDGSSFTVDGVSAETSPYLIFDGTVHPVNIYDKQMVPVTGFIGTGQLSIDNIDDTVYKVIESGVEL